ncbi:DUF4431 domain-containing protein [Buttiauxella sp. S19-1]|uniref:DUF4431 domain-containing protein n=1 Tax=Buttiauxella sp. S19-1 TaxID=941430 RepID=UPI001EDAB687|nr:DUF4431 domain-containing protein [Buttiauxella sp. S19-1]
MRLYLFFIFMIVGNSFADDMKSELKDDINRQQIAGDLHRENICQPVEKSAPLRKEILDGLRESYIGDSNQRVLNGDIPAVKFVVKRLCATNDYAYFCGDASGEARSSYDYDESHLETLLKKGAGEKWVAEPAVLSQQTTLSWCENANNALTNDFLAAQIKKSQQRCVLEGDSVSLTGTLEEKNNSGEVFWVLKPDSPFTCVRDADSHNPDWNQHLQLVLTAEERESLKSLIGKKVTVGGDIFLALSQQHRTPLLLDNLFRLKEIK